MPKLVKYTEPEWDLIKSLWESDKTASQIAAILSANRGIPVTRNQIIGIISRDPTIKRRNPTRPRPSRIANAKIAGAKPAVKIARVTVATLEKKNLSPVPLQAPIATGLVTVETLQPGCCKWPIGNPKQKDFHFCAAPQKAGKPYCEYHCEISYTGKIYVRSEHHVPGKFDIRRRS